MILLLLLALSLASSVSGASLGTGLCTKDEAGKVYNDFVHCQATAQAKMRNGTLTVCEYLKESIDYCADLMSKCQPPKKLRYFYTYFLAL